MSKDERYVFQKPTVIVRQDLLKRFQILQRRGGSNGLWMMGETICEITLIEGSLNRYGAAPPSK